MRWTVGKVTVTKIVELEVAGGSRFILPQATSEAVLPIDWLLPHFADERGRLQMSIHALIVETPDAAHHGRYLPRQRQAGPPHPGTGTTCRGRFLADLAAPASRASSIDTVLCTHLHVDHVGWNTMLAGGPLGPDLSERALPDRPREFAHWRAPREREDMSTRSSPTSVQPIIEAGLADLVETDHRVCDEVRLVPTLGHTPGHVSVRIPRRARRR